MVALETAFEEILDQLHTSLEAARTDESHALSEAASIQIGDRARTSIELPVLWIFFEQAVLDSTTLGIRETWMLPVDLIVVCQADEPDEGYRTANRLAAAARRVVLADRRLGLDYVNDVQSSRLDPSRQYHVDQRLLYSAAATVTVRFFTDS